MTSAGGSQRDSVNVHVEASAPANIALIKYMGKSDTSSHIPTNASLSLTLENFRTTVRIRPVTEGEDSWRPLQGGKLLPMDLSDQGRNKFLQHFRVLKTALDLPGNFRIESANDFPSDCGLASSASSFAALTLAAGEMRRALRPDLKPLSVHELARLSRRGSGSSIRSFAGPWVEWRHEDFKVLDLPLGAVLHAVVIVEQSKKDVSSSEAHKRVLTSALFRGRPERAEARLVQLTDALRAGRWQEAYQLTWAEFWDMHALFETSAPPFGYMTDSSLRVLSKIREVWKSGDGPLATMDAGANVHLIFRPDQEDLRSRLRQDLSAWGQVL